MSEWKIGQKLVHAEHGTGLFGAETASVGNQDFWESLGWTAVPEPAPVERALAKGWSREPPWRADAACCDCRRYPGDNALVFCACYRCDACGEKAGAFLAAPHVEPPAPATFALDYGHEDMIEATRYALKYAPEPAPVEQTLAAGWTRLDRPGAGPRPGAAHANGLWVCTSGGACRELAMYANDTFRMGRGACSAHGEEGGVFAAAPQVEPPAPAKPCNGACGGVLNCTAPCFDGEAISPSKLCGEVWPGRGVSCSKPEHPGDSVHSGKDAAGVQFAWQTAKPAAVVEAPRACCTITQDDGNPCSSGLPPLARIVARDMPPVLFCDACWIIREGRIYAPSEAPTKPPSRPPGLVPQSWGDERMGGIWASRGMR